MIVCFDTIRIRYFKILPSSFAAIVVVFIKIWHAFPTILKFTKSLVKTYMLLPHAVNFRRFCFFGAVSLCFFCSAPQCSHCKRCTSYGNSVRLSVCLSVTRWYCVKTTARSTVQFALSGIEMCLVL